MSVNLLYIEDPDSETTPQVAVTLLSKQEKPSAHLF